MSNPYLFKLRNMHDLYCRFDGVGNSVGLVDIFDAGGVHKYSISFTSPWYIKCPIEWKGAGFRLANSDEQAEFLRALPTENREEWAAKGLDVEDKFYEYQSLFVVDVDSNFDSSFQVQFLAGRIKLHEKG